MLCGRRLRGDGGAGKDIAVVENAMAGCNAVLQSQRLQPGDEVVLVGAMGLVRLPLAEAACDARAAVLRERLLDASFDALLHVLGGASCLRLSAHPYNEMADYEGLAEVGSRVARGNG